MTTPITHVGDQPIDPLARWMATFEVAYALTTTSISELSSAESGLIRKSSGEGLHVKKITYEMLTSDSKLAQEIHGLAINGHLGFISGAKIQFRQDIADKIGSARTFKVFHHDRAAEIKPEDIELEIVGVDEESYSSLAGITLFPEPKLEKKEQKSEEEKKETEPTSSSSSRTAPSSLREKMSARFFRQQTAIQEVAKFLLSQLKQQARKRIKRAREEKDQERSDKHQEIKGEALKAELRNREVLKAETKKSDQQKRLESKELDSKKL